MAVVRAKHLDLSLIELRSETFMACSLAFNSGVNVLVDDVPGGERRVLWQKLEVGSPAPKLFRQKAQSTCIRLSPGPPGRSPQRRHGIRIQEKFESFLNTLQVLFERSWFCDDVYCNQGFSRSILS